MTVHRPCECPACELKRAALDAGVAGLRLKVANMELALARRDVRIAQLERALAEANAQVREMRTERIATVRARRVSKTQGIH